MISSRLDPRKRDVIPVCHRVKYLALSGQSNFYHLSVTDDFTWIDESVCESPKQCFDLRLMHRSIRANALNPSQSVTWENPRNCRAIVRIFSSPAKMSAWFRHFSFMALWIQNKTENVFSPVPNDLTMFEWVAGYFWSQCVSHNSKLCLCET